MDDSNTVDVDYFIIKCDSKPEWYPKVEYIAVSCCVRKSHTASYDDKSYRHAKRYVDTTGDFGKCDTISL